MAKVFSDLQYGVRVYLDESNQADFLDTEVKRSINYAYHDVIKSVISVYEEYYDTTTPFTYAIIAKQQEYAIDQSLIKVARVEVNYNPADSNSSAMRALPIKKDEILSNLNFTNTSNSFFNAGYYLHGPIGAQKVGLVPIPGTSDTTGKSLAVWGVAMPEDMVNPSDNVNIPYADNFASLIELKAASILLSKGQQAEQEATKYINLYNVGIKDMKDFLKERQADMMWMIEDVEAEDIDFSSLGYS